MSSGQDAHSSRTSQAPRDAAWRPEALPAKLARTLFSLEEALTMKRTFPNKYYVSLALLYQRSRS
eukprot:1602461-Pyramimonas_sp.AAC.1